MNSIASVKQMGEQTLCSAPKTKPVTMVEEPVTLVDGSTFQPMPVKTANDALRASLLILFKHVADVHVTVVEIIAEKFNLDADEIHKSIVDDPRWNEMLVNPLIVDLTASVQENSIPPKPAPKKKKAIVVSTQADLVFE